MNQRATIVTFLSFTTSAIAIPTYTATYISPVPGLPSSSALPFSLNDAGAVAFWAYPPDSDGRYRSSAYVWHAGSALRIPTPPGNSYAYHVNNLGLVTGQVEDASSGSARAFLYDSVADTLTFPTLPSGQSIDSLRATNTQGLSGGSFPNPDTGQVSPILWRPASGASPLPLLGTGYTLIAAINVSGQAVGTSGNSIFEAFPFDIDSPRGQTHAVLWNRDGSLADVTPDYQWSMARDINDHGQIVGEYSRPTYVHFPDGTATAILDPFPFLHDPDRGLVTLAAPPGTSALAQAINNAGFIVGSAAAASGQDRRALLWTPDGTMYDLNTLLSPNSGWTLEHAADINAAGQIIGNGTYLAQPAAFLLTPTPEPFTALLLPTMFFTLRRRRH